MVDKQTVPYRDWVLSIALSATLGCVLVAFGWLLIFQFVVGALYPFVTLGLMVGVHALVVKFRDQPLALDPQNTAIQLAVIGGGVVSIVLALLINRNLSLTAMGYVGGGMALVALMTVALDQIRVAGKKRAAEKAMRNAEEARRLAQEGDRKTADEMFQEALLTSEIAYGSNHSQIATIVFYMAELMREMDRTEAATLLFRRAVEVRTAIQDTSKRYVLTLQACADHMREAGLLDDALSMINRAVSDSKKLDNANALTGRCCLTQARILTAQKNLQDAYEAGRTATQLLERSQGKSHPETLEAKALVASHSVNLGRVAEADRILVEVIAEKDKLGEDRDSVYADLLLDLSSVHSKGKPDKAGESILRAARIYRSYVGPEYHRADELISKLPVHLAQGVHPELEQFYTLMFGKETRAASTLLESHPDMAKLTDASGWTILQWALFFDNAEITRISLSQGADIEAGKGTDFPPLYIGTRWANRAALSTLFRKDPDVEIESGDGSRPIHGAVLSGDQLTFDQVVSKKATLEVPDNRGWTPLHLVAFNGDRKFLLQLIPKGMNVNFQAPTTMQTPLHAAVLGGQRGAAETLLLNMAQIDLEDHEGNTPADLAAKKGHQDILEVMRGYADVKEDQPPETETAAEPEVQAESEPVLVEESLSDL